MWVDQDDQVVFVDAVGKERAYKFTGMDELVAGAVPAPQQLAT